MKNKTKLSSNEIIETPVPSWTIQSRFCETAEKYKEKTAIITFSDQQEVQQWQRGNLEQSLCFCYNVSKYVIVRQTETNHYHLISRQNVHIVLDAAGYQIFIKFDGGCSLWDIYTGTIDSEHSWTCAIIDVETPASVKDKVNCKLSYSSAQGLYEFASLLHRHGFITLEKIKTAYIPKQSAAANCCVVNKQITAPCKPVQGDILLLGDKPGAATVGILYLASYLRRNGVNAKCMYINYQYQFSDFQKTLLSYLQAMHPSFVAVSMKWFPHIERVYQIARIVKEYNPQIKIIVGGDTASYFAENVIQEPSIDYVICGDGEVPLLQICKGEKPVWNTYCKDKDRILFPSFVSVEPFQSACSLVPLNEILLDIETASFTSLYIPTAKGCMHNCVQCGGSKNIQIKNMHRNLPAAARAADMVRSDIENTKSNISAYMFSIINGQQENVNYFASIWDGVDLSNHFCALFNTTVIDEALVEKAAKSFRYVRFGIDLCSLSQHHREKLQQQTKVKQLCTDEQLFHFMDICEGYDNCEVDLYLIAGMPLYEECDIQIENSILNRLLQYRCFHGIEWGRLHAQPGADITVHAADYQMTSAASTYDDFHLYSKLNQDTQDCYPGMQSYHYPYVTYTDPAKNTDTFLHYLEMSEKCVRKGSSDFRRIPNEISYHSLDQISDHIAKALIQRGLQQQDNVILYLKDRIHLSAAILAVIKAGGCYIPLDPSFHADSLNHIADSNRIFAVLTDTDISYDKQLQYTELLLQSVSSDIQFPAAVHTALLYRIFTSGSTGVPKCVAIRQAGITNYTNWRICNYFIAEDDVILQPLSEAFDGFGSNFYTALLSGACLVMPAITQKLDVPFLQKICRDYKITHTSLLPFHLDMLLTSKENILESMRSVVVAGDVCSGELIKKTNEEYPHILLINEYGPTECSIASIVHIGMDWTNPAIIGTPISNVIVTLINQKAGAEAEEPGEICIRGIGLYVHEDTDARSMLNATAEYYRTGDIAQKNQDGKFVFIGRKSRLIKKSGIRISLDAIEALLATDPYVEDAAVIQKDGTIIAFIILEPGGKIEAVKRRMSEQTPSYNLPGCYYVIQSLPRHISGKTDYESLSASVSNDSENPQIYQHYESYIAKLWEEELGHRNFTTEENFFDIGGNSLIIMKLYSKLNEKYPDVLSITDMFTYHTIRQLAEYLEKRVGRRFRE